MPETWCAGVLAGVLALGLLADGASAQVNLRLGGKHHADAWEHRHERRHDRREDWRDRDRGRRHDNTGAFIAAGAIGLLAGAAIASANRYDPPPQPIPYDDIGPYTTPYQGRDWHGYCAAKFSTYDPRDGRYLAMDGRRYPCH